MKLIFSVLIGLISISTSSQTTSNQSIDLLINEEIKILNAIFGQKNEIDFNGKKVGFTVGTTGTQIEDKSNFFERYLNPVIEGKDKNICTLIILTDKERMDSGGFDAVIMSPAKIFTKKHREILISELLISTITN